MRLQVNVLQATAAQLDAIANTCGIRRLKLEFRGSKELILCGLWGDDAVTVRVADVGARAMVTTVLFEAAGAPVELTLRPELVGERFDKLLGMTVDIEVGDRVFDRRFVVEAAPAEAARAVLSSSARRALLAFPHDDDWPRVRLGEGMASIAWKRAPDPTLLQHALTALSIIVGNARALHEGVRGVAPGHAFRQDADDTRKVDPREREAARTRLRSARARAVVVLSSSVAAGVGFLAAVILRAM